MRQLVQHRDGCQIERVSGVIVKRADAALAENDIVVAAGHDIFRAHQQLLERVGKPALEQNRFLDRAHLFQKIVILHVARADLNDINILKQRQMLNIHKFCHDRQARFLLGNLKQADALAVQPLEVIRRRARLERAAAQQLRARSLDGLCNVYDLLLRFDRARPCDHRKMPAAEFCIPDRNHSIIWVELTVAAFERVGNALDGIDDIQTFQKGHINPACIANQPQNGLILAERGVHIDLLVPQPGNELIPLFVRDVVLQYDNHGFDLQYNKKCGTVNSVPHANYQLFCASQIDLTIWRQ